MDVTVTPTTIEERPVLRHLMELYQYDFSEYDGTDLSPDGLYGYPYLDYYWVEPERSPFIVRVQGHLAGFALVSRYNYFTGLKDSWVMSEFFIMRKYRHLGIGETTACFLFNRFTGNWQVAQIDENRSATAFWRKVIAGYTQGHFKEMHLDSEHWHGLVQLFFAPPSGVQDGK